MIGKEDGYGPHKEGKKERVYYLIQRMNQLKQKYPEDISTKKAITTVSKNRVKEGAAERIREEYIEDNVQVAEQQRSMLDDFQL